MVKTSVFDCIKGYAESLYDSTCAVIEYIGGEGVINNAQPVTAAEGIPCRLSFKSAPAAGNGAASEVSQSIKLFLPPDIDIKAGSGVIVNHRGVERKFKAAGEPMAYVSHQEVELKSERGYA